MKAYRFYEEFSNKRKRVSEGNVIALCIDERPYMSGDTWVQGAITSIYFHPNSQCCYSAVSLDFLRKKCRRISEQEARRIHPALFDRLAA